MQTLLGVVSDASTVTAQARLMHGQNELAPDKGAPKGTPVCHFCIWQSRSQRQGGSTGR